MATFESIRNLTSNWSQDFPEAGPISRDAIARAEEVYTKASALRLPTPGIFPDPETSGVRLEWLSEESHHLVLAFDGDNPEDSYGFHYDGEHDEEHDTDDITVKGALQFLQTHLK